MKNHCLRAFSSIANTLPCLEAISTQHRPQPNAPTQHAWKLRKHVRTARTTGNANSFNITSFLLLLLSTVLKRIAAATTMSRLAEERCLGGAIEQACTRAIGCSKQTNPTPQASLLVELHDHQGWLQADSTKAHDIGMVEADKQGNLLVQGVLHNSP